MAKYYTRITLTRMAELLDLPVEVSLSVVGLIISLNPACGPHLVVWLLENCGMAPPNHDLRWVVDDLPHNTVPCFCRWHLMILSSGVWIVL
jgi:hypothetical protein